MLFEGDAAGRLAQQFGQPGLAYLDRQPAQVLAVELEQVEAQSTAARFVGQERSRAKTASPLSLRAVDWRKANRLYFSVAHSRAITGLVAWSSLSSS